MHFDLNRATAHWTLKGLARGARDALPVVPPTLFLAMAVGTVAAQKGVTVFEMTLMSGLVFGGAAQLASLEAWNPPLTTPIIVTIALIAAVVNMRLLLMTASFRPWLGDLPAWQSYPTLLLTTDASWLIAEKYRAEGGGDASVLLGSGLLLWIVWVPATAAGHVLGALIADPRPYGLDQVMSIFFMAMLVPLWRGMRKAIPWCVAGVVALAVQKFVPGYWYLITGALAGSIAGGFIDESR
ncbi:MAG TPA: AzlC family ABC transporter permease [Pseudorhodoplanes sp.]|nr:AzlC family ABC transporter permease [Pseudorhodoplanes sp.]